MAILGAKGRIALKRTPPSPEVMQYASVNKAQRLYTLSNPGFRNGDLVEIASTTNWPNTSTSDVGLVPSYIASIPPEWRSNLEMVDYTEPYPGALGTIPYKNQLYISVDQLNRIAFYRNRNSALRNVKTDRESLSEISESDTLEIRLVNDWRLECGLSSWTLNLNADEVDVSGLGDKYYDGVKSLIKGGGTFDFFVDRETYDSKNATIISLPNYQNAVVWTDSPDVTTYIDASVTDNSPDTTGNYNNASVTGVEPAPRAYQLMARSGTSNLMRLLLETTDQAKAEAEFWMIQGEEPRGFYADRVLEPGDLFYRANILVTSTAISTNATEVITGSATFVTVQDVELLEGPE
jgi:hypothetical protein